MDTIALNEYGNAVVDGKEYGTHSFDMNGCEAITIPSLAVSYTHLTLPTIYSV